MSARNDERRPSNVIKVDFGAKRRSEDGTPPSLWPAAIADLDAHLHRRRDSGEPDPDRYGLWEEATTQRPADGRELLYGAVGGGRVVVADAALVGSINARRDEIRDDEAEWEDAVPWLEQEMSTLLPADLLERYTKASRTALDGDVPRIDAGNAQPLVEALQQRGFSCRRDDAAVRSACGY